MMLIAQMVILFAGVVTGYFAGIAQARRTSDRLESELDRLRFEIRARLGPSSPSYHSEEITLQLSEVTLDDAYFVRIFYDPTREGLIVTTKDGTKYLCMGYLDWHDWPSCKKLEISLNLQDELSRQLLRAGIAHKPFDKFMDYMKGREITFVDSSDHQQADGYRSVH